MSASVARMPAAIAARLPRFCGKSMTRTRPLAVAATFRISTSVSSVEPSLTATISSLSAGYSSSSSERSDHGDRRLLVEARHDDRDVRLDPVVGLAR